MMVDPSFSSATFYKDGGGGKFGGEGARSILSGDRFAEIARRMSYFDCTQHDGKFWDFEGRPINPKSMQPLIGQERAFWVPLSSRRPSMPVRLGTAIVSSFTNLLFGENRFPTIRIEGDKKSEDWVQTVARIGKLAAKMIQARNYGGATGTSGVSWCFRDGKPMFEAHKPQNLFVHSWANRNERIPEHVTELYLFNKVQWDGKGFNKVWYWYRRDWTPEEDIVFKDVIFDKEKDPVWIIDPTASVMHGDNRCHLEWIQNMPSDEIDGVPDYHGLYDQFDTIDLMMSVITKGGIRNLDPTVKLKMDRDEIDRLGMKKGSDNALVVGKDGDADYMELGGSSIDAGLKLVQEQRRQILETAQCIIPDPNEVAAQGVSSVAIKAMFAPMTAKTDILREQYGTAMERILDGVASSAREKTTPIFQVPAQITAAAPPAPAPNPADDLLGGPAKPAASHASADDLLGGAHPAKAAADDILGQPKADIPDAVIVDDEPPPPEEVQFVVILPPKMVEEPLIDPLTGQPSGEMTMKAIPRELGPGGETTFQWPPYFSPTPQDQSQITASLAQASGGKAIISQETAVEVAARAYNVDPAEEWRRVQAETSAQAAQQAQMFDAAAAGGQVGSMTEAPPGADPLAPKPTPPSPVDDLLGPVDPDAHIPVDRDLTGG